MAKQRSVLWKRLDEAVFYVTDNIAGRVVGTALEAASLLTPKYAEVL